MTISREQIALMKQKNQLHFSSSGAADDTNVIQMDEAIKKCNDYVKVNAGSSLRLAKDSIEKDNKYRVLIYDYVDKKTPKVDGFYGTEDGLSKLKIALYNSVRGYGKLSGIMEPSDGDPDSEGYQIDEIRINELDNIWVEKSGVATRMENIKLTDDELSIITSRLLEVSQGLLGPGSPVQNARTKENYRVNIVHGSVSYAGSNVAVIRKFKSKHMTARELIEKKTLSVNMFKTAQLVTDSDSSFVTVGATGSGKTVTNGIFLRNIRNNSRLFSIENPVEMPLRKIDRATGRVVNDVVQYEAQSVSDNPDALFPVEIAVETSLRQSPHWLILGESRTPGEFVAALTAGQTGHCFATSYHAEGGLDALKRYLTAYLKKSNEPANLAMANICSSLRFIFSQQKLPDGSRKIMEISEVFPPKSLDSTTPVVIPLYKFEVSDVVYDPTRPGEYVVKEMIGKHKRVNPLSEINQERWIKHGVSADRFKFLTEDVPNEEERYVIYDTDEIPLVEKYA